MINGVGVVIFNDANVMTTDDIVTTCQRDRAQPAPEPGVSTLEKCVFLEVLGFFLSTY